MSNKEEKQPKETPKRILKKAAVPKFSAVDLKEHSIKLFGVKPYVFAGAFHGKEQTLVTKEEAKKVINQYLNRKGGNK